MPIPNQTLDRWVKLASICCTAVILPGIGWAFRTTQEIHEISGRVSMLHQQMESDRKGMNAVLDELRNIRTSVESLRADVLQRLTRVETKVESR